MRELFQTIVYLAQIRDLSEAVSDSKAKSHSEDQCHIRGCFVQAHRYRRKNEGAESDRVFCAQPEEVRTSVPGEGFGSSEGRCLDQGFSIGQETTDLELVRERVLEGDIRRLPEPPVGSFDADAGAGNQVQPGDPAPEVPFPGSETGLLVSEGRFHGCEQSNPVIEGG